MHCLSVLIGWECYRYLKISNQVVNVICCSIWAAKLLLLYAVAKKLSACICVGGSSFSWLFLQGQQNCYCYMLLQKNLVHVFFNKIFKGCSYMGNYNLFAFSFMGSKRFQFFVAVSTRAAKLLLLNALAFKIFFCY